MNTSPDPAIEAVQRREVAAAKVATAEQTAAPAREAREAEARHARIEASRQRISVLLSDLPAVVESHDWQGGSIYDVYSGTFTDRRSRVLKLVTARVATTEQRVVWRLHDVGVTSRGELVAGFLSGPLHFITLDQIPADLVEAFEHRLVRLRAIAPVASQ